MARRLRGNRERPERITPVERNIGTMSYAATQLRGHCPTCGMMANIERFQEAQHEVDAWMQYYGGEIKQHYERAAEYDNDLMRTILAHLDNTRAYLMGELGIETEEIEEEESEIEEEVEEIEEPEEEFEEEMAPEENEVEEEEEEEPYELTPPEEEEFDEEGEFPEWPEDKEEMELDEEGEEEGDEEGE